MTRMIVAISERIIVMEGWKAALVAIFAGALSALSLAPYHASPILLATIPTLVWLMDGAVAPAGSVSWIKRIWPAFKTGWLFAFGYFLAGFWWVGKAFLVDADEFVYLLPFAVVALPAGLALFWGCALAIARLAWRDGWTRILVLACTIAFAEWVRGTILTGLPWNVPGYAAMPTPLLMQSSALVGLYGMTFFAMLVSATPALLAPGWESHRRAVTSVVCLNIVLVFGHVGYGIVTLSQADDSVVEGVKLRLVQPALDQSEKWDEANEQEIMQRYLDLSNANRGPQEASAGAFTHIIWPESAFPFILTERRDQLAAIARLLPPTTTLITGAMRLERSPNNSNRDKVFNSLYVINSNGEIIQARDKTRLLPFGEFLPFQNILESIGLQQLTQLRGGFAAGVRRSAVSMANAPAFLPLICYEIIFSGAVMPTIADSGPKPEWIVNLTNDAWFGLTAGPYQHAHQAQVRGVEERLPVVRAANNGISFVSDSYGRIRASLALGQRGVVDAQLPVATASSLFSEFGNIPFLIFTCVMYTVLLVTSITNTKRLWGTLSNSRQYAE